MPPYVKVNAEALRATEDILEVTKDDLTLVRDMALVNPRGRARLCAHQSDADPLHEMLIALVKDNYITPHRHPGKSESFHMIEGSLSIIAFSDDGQPVRRIDLTAPGGGKAFYYRLATPLFHTVIPTSEVAVFHETTNGPFRRQDTAFADWAPAETADPVQQRTYIHRILQIV